MDTAVYAFYATFSFVCSCIFLIACGLGLYSLYLTRQGGEIPEEAKKKNLSFLYNRTIGIAFLIGGIIFGIAGYRMSPSAVAERMGISLEAEHHPEEAVHKKAHHVAKAREEVKKAEVKKEEKEIERQKKEVSKGLRKYLMFEAEDISAVPPQFLCVDDQKVRAWLQEHREEAIEKVSDNQVVIPGIKVWIDERYISR